MNEDKLIKLIAEMSWYLDHKNNCGIYTSPGCDTCTCGMKLLKDKARKIYAAAKKPINT
jgi:hypothetical protein